MKVTELIKNLQNTVDTKGDIEIVFETNRHKYDDFKLVSKDNAVIVALCNKQLIA